MGITDNKGRIRMMSELIDLAVFPGTQGGPLEHVIAAKAVAFGEALLPSYKEYIQTVKQNSQTLANILIQKNYEIISGGTDNHLMLIDLRNKNISGKKAEQVLGLADITLNKNMVPYDDKSPFVTSGIRIGTAAISTRGVKSADMDLIANWIDLVLQNPDNQSIIENVKQEVNKFMREFPLS
jgi:glycine hydroxymethyltransferase